MIKAYVRVSTDRQDLESQKLEISKYADANGLHIDEWIEIKISSRKKSRDRQITVLLNRLKKGDELIITELSRLARSIREIHNIIHIIAQKKATLHVIKQNLVTKNDNDMATKIYINAFAMAAEIERDLISQRTKNGLALAKKRGVKLGNPNLKADNRKRIDRADKFAEKHRDVISALINEGKTQRQIVEVLNKSGITTPKGNEWTLVALQRTLKRLKLETVKAVQKRKLLHKPKQKRKLLHKPKRKLKTKRSSD